VGDGASFTVTLPIRRETAADAGAIEWGATQKLTSGAAADVVEQAGSGELRVVVAEDNPDMRRHLRSVLEGVCRLTLCSNGKLALDAVRSEPPDVVVSDVMMPVMDGLELTRQIRADEKLRAIPVVLLTARVGDDATVEGLDAGADDYVAKPFSTAELVARVRAAARAHILYRELSASQVQLAQANRALRKATEDLAQMEDLAVMGQLTVDAQREVAEEKGNPARDSRANLQDAMSILERVSLRLSGLNKPR
jgi:DNA-binding response OmpR family regulator